MRLRLYPHWYLTDLLLASRNEIPDSVRAKWITPTSTQFQKPLLRNEGGEGEFIPCSTCLLLKSLESICRQLGGNDARD